MSHLGSFGAALRELDQHADKDTFDFFGQRFTVHAVLPPMLMFQLGAGMTGKMDEMDAMAAMWEAWRISLTVPEHDGKPADESQFATFYQLAIKERADLETLVRVATMLYQAQSGRPTERQPVSSAGLSSTSPSSSTSSSHPAFAHLRPVDQVLTG